MALYSVALILMLAGLGVLFKGGREDDTRLIIGGMLAYILAVVIVLYLVTYFITAR